MTDLDDEVKDALRRVAPPVGFAERVLARTERPALPPAARRRNRSAAIRWAAAAALAAAIGGGAVQYRSVQKARAERAAGEAAKEQVMLALQITADKLHLVQRKINDLHEQPQRKSDQ